MYVQTKCVIYAVDLLHRLQMCQMRKDFNRIWIEYEIRQILLKVLETREEDKEKSQIK